jgi:hypothetical protein
LKLNHLKPSNFSVPNVTFGTKKSQKTVDPEPDWVYIHECQPFKGSLRSAILRTHPWLSRITLNWGSSAAVQARLHLRRNGTTDWRGFPGRHSVSKKSHNASFGVRKCVKIFELDTRFVRLRIGQ